MSLAVTPSVALTGNQIYSSCEKFTSEQKTECYTHRFDFQQYMTKFENKAETTIGLYSSAIRRISKLLSWKIGKKVDIYQINDLTILANIRKEFDKGGKLHDYYLSSSTSNNIHIQAIETYIRFISIKELGTVVSVCQKNRSTIKTGPTPSPQTRSITKNEAIYVCRSNGLNINERVTFASKNKSFDIYWVNPDIRAILQDWSLILNDLIHYKLHIFNIPRGSIREWQIKVRPDLPNKIDLQILYEDELFRDMRSGIQFCNWFVKTISYAN
jgi:hypothetical protein